MAKQWAMRRRKHLKAFHSIWFRFSHWKIHYVPFSSSMDFWFSSHFACIVEFSISIPSKNIKQSDVGFLRILIRMPSTINHLIHKMWLNPLSKEIQEIMENLGKPWKFLIQNHRRVCPFFYRRESSKRTQTNLNKNITSAVLKLFYRTHEKLSQLRGDLTNSRSYF